MPSAAKLDRLRAIATSQGAIAAVAMDQRRSLRGMIAAATGVAADRVPDSRLRDFKCEVVRALSPFSSAVLLDPEYGDDAALRAPGCGLLVTYEADGFENPRPHRMLALIPGASVRRLRDSGAGAVKILLSYAPDGDHASNDEKRAWIERIGNECDALDMPFLLEPVVYPADGADPRSPEFVRRKPGLVARTMEEFSRPVYKVDLLKVEFPVGASAAGSLIPRTEALDWYRAADSAAGRCPYIYLSAGIPIDEFIGSLELAVESGAAFSGVLCGRAIWQDGIPAFVAGGPASFAAWLARDGARNLDRINACLVAAAPWNRHIRETPA
jgi:tagatose 1,6-diphosphate aldolase